CWPSSLAAIGCGFDTVSGLSSGQTTQNRNRKTVEMAAIVPTPPMRIAWRAKRSSSLTDGRVVRGLLLRGSFVITRSSDREPRRGIGAPRPSARDGAPSVDSRRLELTLAQRRRQRVIAVLDHRLLARLAQHELEELETQRIERLTGLLVHVEEKETRQR